MTNLMIHSMTVVYLDDCKRIETHKHTYSYEKEETMMGIAHPFKTVKRCPPRKFSFKKVNELRRFVYKQMKVNTKRDHIVKVKTTKGQYFFIKQRG